MRGFFLLITYTRPRRRTTRQFLSRTLAERRLLRTLMTRVLYPWKLEGALGSWMGVRCQAEERDPRGWVQGAQGGMPFRHGCAPTSPLAFPAQHREFPHA